MPTRATRVARRIALGFVALVSAIALTIGSAVVGAVSWAATTVLVVPGTGTKDPSLVPGYQENAVSYYVAPTGACAEETGGCQAAPVPYIAEIWPIPLPGWGGLTGAKFDDSVASGVASLNRVYDATDPDSPIVIFGYSQGGAVVSEVKQQLSEREGGIPSNVSFVLIGSTNRPNGGTVSRPSFLGHVPILDVTFKPGTTTATAAPGVINTTDVGFQYDGVSDFPRYPINLLATANAVAGFRTVHGTYLAPKGTNPPWATPVGYRPDEIQSIVEAATDNCTAANHCQVSGDTRYVTIPARILPIMLPLLDLAAATGTTALVRPLVDLVSPMARVIIETGYERADYGRQTPLGLFPTIDPVRFGTDLLDAAALGVSQAVTGTGDASRYLESKPTEPTTATDELDATESNETEPVAQVSEITDEPSVTTEPTATAEAPEQAATDSPESTATADTSSTSDTGLTAAPDTAESPEAAATAESDTAESETTGPEATEPEVTGTDATESDTAESDTAESSDPESSDPESGDDEGADDEGDSLSDAA